jgi:hypothetical protein
VEGGGGYELSLSPYLPITPARGEWVGGVETLSTPLWKIDFNLLKSST